ncbi:hypothetical protein [Rhodopirellula sallentina]|uniref:Uncharacterized protein n=1 Tax=Rhodopirellula sallentina SM41 TaxID=1263870 RepID=M5U876_9BACT|nr:hypothetical protein [Rhodopirellula sallentina]EMI57662.1 hypothetical protein RSSM_00916 [Rhodopirellula sallentina SM41]
MKSRSASTILNESYLETRAKLLEVAAIFDRIDRAGVEPSRRGCEELTGEDAMRREQLSQAVRILLDDSANRAEQIQQLFSREYNPDWRAAFGLMPEHASTAQSRSQES